MKISRLSLLWLTAVFFIYPALHESGHAFSAMLTGAEVVGAQLFPVPLTVVDTSGAGETELWLIYMGGVMFAPAAVICLKGRDTVISLVRLMLAAVCAGVSLLNGIQAAVGTGSALFGCDAADLLSLCPRSGRLIMISSTASLLVSAAVMLSVKPADVIRRSLK